MVYPKVFSGEWFVRDSVQSWLAGDDTATFRTKRDAVAHVCHLFGEATHVTLLAKGKYRVHLAPKDDGNPRAVLIQRVTRTDRRFYEKLVVKQLELMRNPGYAAAAKEFAPEYDA